MKAVNGYFLKFNNYSLKEVFIKKANNNNLFINDLNPLFLFSAGNVKEVIDDCIDLFNKF